MSDVDKITCPECNTPNAPNAPFCENCGYRLRRPGTVKEGLSAVTRDQVREFRSRTGQDKAVTFRKVPDTEPEQPAVRDDEGTLPEPIAPVPETLESMEATLVESEPITPEMLASWSAETEKDSTMLEGLEPVEPMDLAEQTERIEDVQPTVRRHEPITPLDSATFVLQNEERRMSAALLSAIWIVSTAALMLVTYYLTSRQADSQVELRADSARVSVEGGAFKRGLNEQIRAFIIMTCQKVSENAKEDCLEEVLLEGEYPEKLAKAGPFEIDNYEVTAGRYARCVEAEKCVEIDYKSCKVYTNRGLQVGLRVPKAIKESQMPASCVTRDEAQAFCEFEGGRLPTHDEWEKAARGTKGPIFPWGDTWVADYANWGEVDVIRSSAAGKIDGYEWAAPPGSYDQGKSPYDLFDMAGNVAEWVAEDDESNGHARGGSWASNPFEIRTTGRIKLVVDSRRADVGFRCLYD